MYAHARVVVVERTNVRVVLPIFPDHWPHAVIRVRNLPPGILQQWQRQHRQSYWRVFIFTVHSVRYFETEQRPRVTWWHVWYARTLHDTKSPVATKLFRLPFTKFKLARDGEGYSKLLAFAQLRQDVWKCRLLLALNPNPNAKKPDRPRYFTQWRRKEEITVVWAILHCCWSWTKSWTPLIPDVVWENWRVAPLSNER